MWNRIFVVTLLVLPLAGAEPKYVKRLNAAGEVFNEIMAVSDKAIPQNLLDGAECVVIVPGTKKGAFIFGGKYGRGFLSCRNKNGVGWTAPGGVRIEGFNFGLQAGGSETDIVMLVMNQKGMRRLLRSRFTLGGDASAAAGPVGRTVEAKTDALLTAEILAYSRTRGVFAGVSLDGATLRQDKKVNNGLYGYPYENRYIITNDMSPSKDGQKLVSLLNKYSARKGR